MPGTTSPTISTEYISTSASLGTLLESFDGLPNDPASFYFSLDSRNLIIYVAPASNTNLINLSFLDSALQCKDQSAIAFKAFLKASQVIRVFFHAHIPAKVLFDRYGIELANKVQFV